LGAGVTGVTPRPGFLLPDVALLVPGAARLQAPQAAAALLGAGFEVGPFRAGSRTLLDTFDGRLHAAGIRIEVHTDGGIVRLVVAGGGPAPAQMDLDGVPAVAADLPAGPIRSRLAPILDVRALVARVTLATRQATAIRRNGEGKAVVRVALQDELTLAAGARLSVPWAAEVTALEGYPRAFRQAQELLASLGLDRRPGDVLGLAAEDAGVDPCGFVDSPTVSLDPAELAVAGFRRVLSNLSATIDANWQGTVDDVDPEFLHDLRVAVRRTRSVLTHGKQVLPAGARDHFGGEFRWLGTVTGPARDADVYVIEWPGYVSPLDPASVRALAPVIGHIEGRRAIEHSVLAGHLTSPRYQGLMAGWRAWLDGPVESAALAKRSNRALGLVVASRLAEAQARLLARGRGIGPATPAEELHELRKDAKRLRYLLECFGGLLPAATRKPYVQRLKALQDNLGEHQDTEVHTAQLRSISQELQGAPGMTPETLLAMGRLTELFEQRRQVARSLFAERFKSYDAKPTARALALLLDVAAGR